MNHTAVHLLPAALIDMDRLQAMQAAALQTQELRVKVDELKDQKAALDTEKGRLEKDKAGLKGDLDDAKQRVRALQAVVQDHKKRAERLDAKVKRMRKTQEASRFVDSITRLVSGLYILRDYIVQHPFLPAQTRLHDTS